MAKLQHFIIIYSLAARELVDVRRFQEDIDAALECYAELEGKYRDQSDDFEIVLIGADSLETVEETHSHYFGATHTGVPFSELVGNN